MVRRLNNDRNTSTPNTTPMSTSKKCSTNTMASLKNSSHCSFNNQTPNRSGTSSRHSYSMRSNDSRSFENSSYFAESPINTRPHDKSKDRRSSNSSMCLGDFLTTASGSKAKSRRSLTLGECASSAIFKPNTSCDKDFPSFTPKGKMNRMVISGSTTPDSAKSKPIKRIKPVTVVSNATNEFSCLAFRSENNLLQVDEEDFDTARDMLKTQKDAIQKIFRDEKPVETNIRAFLQEKLIGRTVTTINAPPIDLTKITSKSLLDRFIDIYSIIIDLNLITNVLTEISYLVNLINIDTEQYFEQNPHKLVNEPITGDGENSSTVDRSSASVPVKSPPTLSQPSAAHLMDGNSTSICAENTLDNVNNCVYFGLGVLSKQKHVLGLLDTTSIKVLLENDRLTQFAVGIKDMLFRVYSHKMRLESSLSRPLDNSFKVGNGLKVFYQQEQDTKMNFPSDREFGAFKKQRDAFYGILR